MFGLLLVTLSSSLLSNLFLENCPRAQLYEGPISGCDFVGLSGVQENGGAIKISSCTCTLNISNSMFRDCSAYSGGAVYFVGSNATMTGTTATTCRADNLAAFFYLFVSNRQGISMNFTSSAFGSCSGDTMKFQAREGIILLNLFNSTYSSATQLSSGFRLEAPSSLFMEYCRFESNLQENCLYLRSSSDQDGCYCLFVINNTCNVPSNSLVHVVGNYMIRYGVFIESNAVSLFGSSDVGPLALVKCVFDTNISTSGSLNLITAALNISSSIGLPDECPYPIRSPYFSGSPVWIKSKTFSQSADLPETEFFNTHQLSISQQLFASSIFSASPKLPKIAASGFFNLSQHSLISPEVDASDDVDKPSLFVPLLIAGIVIILVIGSFVVVKVVRHGRASEGGDVQVNLADDAQSIIEVLDDVSAGTA